MTYEYVCEACGNQWEAEQSIKESPLKKCVSCGENKAKRLVSGGTGFLLKGGGWYADLYGSPGSGSKKPSDDKAGKTETAASTGSGASDAKTSTVEAKPSTSDKSASSAAAAGSTASPAPPPAAAANSAKKAS